MTISEEYGVVLAGREVRTGDIREICSPYDGRCLTRVHLAREVEVASALAEAANAEAICRELPTYVRYEALQHVSRRIAENREVFGRAICEEAGKPIRFALGEADRAVQTFSLAADLVRQSVGEVLPLDLSAALQGRRGIVEHFPIGTVLAIAPFNFPLNLVAHKVAPAMARGCPLIIKPAVNTPVSSLMLAELILETDWPKAALSVLPTGNDLAQRMVEDERVKLLSFTGSPGVGWMLKSVAGKKKVSLELGGDAAVIVDASADLDAAAEKIVTGAFAYAGQVCISVQRIIVHEAVYNPFREKLAAVAAMAPFGDPRQESTLSGPMINAGAKDRILDWVKEAQTAGASMVSGSNTAEGNVVCPMLIEGVGENVKLGLEEAFAPVAVLHKVPNMEAAFLKANASRFGLQAGLFTDSEALIRKAFRELQVGGLIVNHTPTLRVDNMPYGGIKDSGFGREGLKYAMEDMSELKVMVW